MKANFLWVVVILGINACNVCVCVRLEKGSECTFCLSFSHYYFAFCNKSFRRENTLIQNNNRIIFLIINNFICKRANCVRAAFASHCLALLFGETPWKRPIEISDIRTDAFSFGPSYIYGSDARERSVDTVRLRIVPVQVRNLWNIKERNVEVDGNMYRVLMNTFTSESSK